MAPLNFDQLTIERHPSGRPHKIRGDMLLGKAPSDEAAISEFLKVNAVDLQLGIDPASLRLDHTTQTPARIVYRYQQFIGDVPVHNSHVIVQTDHKHTIKQIEFGHLADVRVAAIRKAGDIGPDAAFDAALKHLGTVSLRRTRPDPSKVYFPTNAGLRLAYLVLIPTHTPMHDWQVFVDAKTGEVLETEDLIKTAPDGSGYVFDPNPIVTANDNTYRQPTATIAGGCGYAGTALATIDAQRVTRTLKDLKLSGGVYSFEGPYAKIVDITPPASAIPTEAGPTNFIYSSSDERLGAVNV